jgi:membrane dipeptidase
MLQNLSIVACGFAMITFGLCWAIPGQAPDSQAHAIALLKQSPLIDGHNDFPWEVRVQAGSDLAKLDMRRSLPGMMTDIPRLRAGGVGAQFWSTYIPPGMAGQQAVTAELEQIDIVCRMAERYPDVFEIARTADDVERIFKAGKIASMIGVEGGHAIDSSLGVLRMYARLGARYMTLTHSKNVPWADSATDTPEHNGLTPFGEQVIREMNRLGMLVDLSHVSPKVMEDVLKISTAPVIFSHSSARALCDVPRNVPDNILKQIPKNGGIVMVSFVRGFTTPQAAAWEREQEAEQARIEKLAPNDESAVKSGLEAWRKIHPRPPVGASQIADHIDYIRKVAGIDHVGIGSDFDGISAAPDGMEDVSRFPALVMELLKRGYTDNQVKKVTGQNALRVMRAAERAASK